MVYLVELLVVMTDRLKIVRIPARNVQRVHRNKRLDDDSLSLSRCRKATVFCSRCAGARRSVETQKNSSWENAHVWQWPLSKKVVATVCPLHLDTKSEQRD